MTSRSPTARERAQRVMAALVVVPFSLVVTVLLLADRAPGITIGWLSRLWVQGSALQLRLGIDLVDRTDIPLSVDAVGHFALWFAAGVLGRSVFSGVVRTRTLFVGLGLASVGFELAQGLVTSSRKVQLSDAMANGLGVAAGLLVGAMVAGLMFSDRRVRSEPA